MLNRSLFSFALIVSMTACATNGGNPNQSPSYISPTRQTEMLYEGMFEGGKTDIPALRLFLTKMPKGGDLHHHFTGSIYAETYLDWVAGKGWLIDSCTLRIVESRKKGQCQALTVDALVSDNSLYRKLLTLWSDNDYQNHYHDQPPPDSNFFNTFDYFGPISNEYINVGLTILKQRAIDENVSYIETMLTRVGIESSDYYSKQRANEINAALRSSKSPGEIYRQLDEIAKHLGAEKSFNAKIDHFIATVEKNHQGIDDGNFTMRYQTYAVRTLDPLQVFADLYASHLAAEKSPLVVGVNIVAPENNQVALADYTLHMYMFRYLQERFPSVNRALHAGELTLGMVRPKDLLFHIRQALEIAHAQRIGHGVDLPYEKDSEALLEALKQNAVVEINLTSNEFILGVKDNEHPYRIYSRYGVPLVISTDDSGVSRDNLTNEYVKLASRYHPTYGKIKEYAYNSINYAFLSPDEKRAKIRQLDSKFAKFEDQMAGLRNKLAYTDSAPSGQPNPGKTGIRKPQHRSSSDAPIPAPCELTATNPTNGYDGFSHIAPAIDQSGCQADAAAKKATDSASALLSPGGS